jgi:para-nitrobenzyl esterase
MESGNCAAEPLSQRYENHARFVDALNCSRATNVVQCLQSAPASAFVNAVEIPYFVSSLRSQFGPSVDAAETVNLPLGPTVDHFVLDDVPLATIEAGKHNHVPLVIGTNAQEATDELPKSLFPSLLGRSVISCAEFVTLVNTMFPGVTQPGVARKLLETYPCNSLAGNNAGYAATIALATDSFFACPSRRVLRAAASTQTEPVYRYFYTHTDSSGPIAPLGATHSAEIPFVFGTFSWYPSATFVPTPTEITLSQQMQGYWANLASGNPNGGNLPTWKAYDPTVDNALQLDTPIKDTSGIVSGACDLWDTLQ